MKLISQDNMEEVLNWSYDKAINGVSKFSSAYDLAQEYKTKYPDNLAKQIDSFINWQCARAGLSGAITGIGGFATMAFTLPANIASVIAIQLRMIATIAILCGYNVKSDKVQTLVYCCLVKQKMDDIIKSIGVQIAQKAGVKLIQRIPKDIIKIINKTVGFKLITKFGQKGCINLGKAIPFLGAALGATIDFTSTKSIGVFTKKALVSNKTKQNFIDAKVVEE